MTSVTVGWEVGCQILKPDAEDEFIKSYQLLDRQNFLHNLIRPISNARRDLIEIYDIHLWVYISFYSRFIAITVITKLWIVIDVII